MSAEPCLCGDPECKRCYPYSYRMAGEEEPDGCRFNDNEEEMK